MGKPIIRIVSKASLIDKPNYNKEAEKWKL